MLSTAISFELASIPSPSESVWHLGPIPLRAYAMSIIVGVVLALWITDRRLKGVGGPAGAVVDIAVYAIPAGIIGARLYHVFTTPGPYFGDDGNLVDILKMWKGGLGIWGAIAGGALGAWYGCRARGIPLRIFADALAPGLAVAQAVGRWGNWFNQELYGRPLNTWWALEIDPEHRTTENLDQATYHPTFLYESLWCLGVAALVWWAGRRFQLGHGRIFALYVMAYVTGRAWIESLRIDPAEEFFGLRLNIWTSAIVFAGALAYFLLRKGGAERLIERPDGSYKVVAAVVNADDSSVADTSSESSTESTAAEETQDAGEDEAQR